MAKVCPKCSHEWPDNFQSCPLDSTPLVSNAPTSGLSLKLGDANAISGGVNLSDNHSINNTTTSNVDSHNVITNNITQIEREKSAEEIKHEKELAFREACKDVYSNGLMTSEEKRKLDDLQYKLGLDDSIAAWIISEVARRSERKSAILSPVHQITFNNIKTAILANRLDIVNRLLAQLKAMVQKYSAEEIQYTYYMLLAVLHPEECIAEYKSHREDKYWQSFWSSIAYRKIGQIEDSEILVADVGDKWIDTIPQENVFILAAVNAILDEEYDIAKSLYDNITGDYSPLLTNLATCIYVLLYSDTLGEDDLSQMQKECEFFSTTLFSNHVKCVENQQTNGTQEVKEPAKPEKVEENYVVIENKESERNFQTSKDEQLKEKKGKDKALTNDTPIEQTSKEIDILAKPAFLFELKNKSAAEQLAAYKQLLDEASKGNGRAGAYLAYFYIFGMIVSEDLVEAEKRIMSGSYQTDPILIQLLVDMYTRKGIPALADIWKKKLNVLK